MKKIFSLLGIFVITMMFSQKNETYIKANALFAPVGIINVGVEHGLSKHFTAQADVLVSPWKSFAGHEALVGMISLEGRYYFSEAFNHWYVGLTSGFGVFKIQKWNYWNDDIYYDHFGDLTPYITSDLYQKGFSFQVGLNFGYQFNIGKRWNMDMYLTYGMQQGFYKGYVRGLPETQENRYDRVENWDISTEYIPYRVGVMFSYKL